MLFADNYSSGRIPPFFSQIEWNGRDDDKKLTKKLINKHPENGRSKAQVVEIFVVRELPVNSQARSLNRSDNGLDEVFTSRV